MEALGENTIEKAVEVLKQLVDESIAEEEEEDKLYQELDGLLEGVDFAEPLTPEYISSYTDENKTTEETSSVHISSQEVSKTILKTSLNIFLIKNIFLL